MTCQHCQTQNCETQILDDDYRCRRCGSRVRSTPLRASAIRYPVEAAATARAYEVDYAHEYHSDTPIVTDSSAASSLAGGEQKRLFDGFGSDARVIPFDSLTSRADRQSIHARATGLSRPAPLKTERVQVKHARPAKTPAGSRPPQEQRRLEFEGQDDILPQPRPSIICDAPVAPARLRLTATIIDGAVIAMPCLFAMALYLFAGGSLTGDRYTLPLLFVGFATIPVFYKLLWAVAGCDSIGFRQAGLQLVDFDGNPPSLSRRFQRFLGSFLSLLAAGIGLIWSLVDEDRLTWHDHISNTFPTFVPED